MLRRACAYTGFSASALASEIIEHHSAAAAVADASTAAAAAAVAYAGHTVVA